MIDQDHPRGALDVGSNTIRLLVARVKEGALEQVLDESVFVRLGTGVNHTGLLEPARQDAALQVIRDFADLARRTGVRSLPAIATSAVRDAQNGKAFVHRVREETGVEVEIISGEREAELTFLGATLGIPTGDGEMIVDLGGGSAELIFAEASGMCWARSLLLGSGRLSEQFVRHDPPRQECLDSLADHVTSLLQGLPPARVQRGIFTGGTASHVALMLGRQEKLVELTLESLEKVMLRLRAEPSGEIVRQFNIRPERAEVLPAGVYALQTIAKFYQLSNMCISRNGIREGMILEALGREGQVLLGRNPV